MEGIMNLNTRRAANPDTAPNHAPHGMDGMEASVPKYAEGTAEPKLSKKRHKRRTRQTDANTQRLSTTDGATGPLKKSAQTSFVSSQANFNGQQSDFQTPIGQVKQARANPQIHSMVSNVGREAPKAMKPVQAQGGQQRKKHRQARSARVRTNAMPGDDLIGIQQVNLAGIDVPAFYRAINVRYQLSKAQKTIFVVQKSELAMHNNIARARLRDSLSDSDGAVLVGMKQCENSMDCILAGRSANQDAYWSAQIQRLRDEYENMLHTQKAVAERMLAQRQAECVRWQEKVEMLQGTSGFSAN